MLNLAQMLYGGGGRAVSAQSNQNGAGIVELGNENNPYTFGDMYGIPPAATAVSAPAATAGPSAAYIADKSAKYPGQGVPGNPRPSEYHWWIPGMGWQFIPEYDAGNNLGQQYQNMNPVQLDNAYANGYTHQMSAGAQAVADATGTTVTTGPAFGYEAQYPENGATTTATTTPTTPQYTANDVNSLYLKHLNRDAEEAGLTYWLNYLNSGGSLAELEYNILNSDEYLANQANGSGGNENNGGGGTVDGGGGGEKELLGYYWFNTGSGWQWYAYYTGEAAPAGAITAGPESVPTGQPDGWQNPNNAGGGDTTTGGGENPVVETPQLYTPTGDQFFQGMFTANDMLFRDGGDVDSTFYGNLRKNILASLAQTASDNGRTQNTAEEIALAQGGNNSYSATSLFSPTIAGLYRQMGL